MVLKEKRDLNVFFFENFMYYLRYCVKFEVCKIRAGIRFVIVYFWFVCGGKLID